jgi:hypothetical protein
MTLASDFVKCVPSEESLAKCHEGETEERTPIDVECEEDQEAQGVWSHRSAKEVTGFTADFIGCKALGVECANSGNGVRTDTLKGTLGYIKKATPKEVGIDWKPEYGKVFVKFACGESMTIVVGGASEKEGPFYSPKGAGGAVIAKISPLNEMVEKAHEEFNINAETDANVPSSFEGKSPQAFEDYFINTTVAGKGSKWGPAGLALTQALSLCGNCNNAAKSGAEIKA